MNQTAREYLVSLELFGMKFGLANIGALCDALGHPERSFQSIIVAGTNGKGSVTAMTDTALRAAGHRSARYTSPHLVRLEERFVIDGTEVAPPALDEGIERARAAADALMARGVLDAPPTFFECTTAVAFDLFRDAGVDIAVLEVGLGGRLDATNVVSPIAAAIVSIDVDHEQQLGSRLESIAWEKAGVVKPAIPVVCGEMAPAAQAVIESVCRERGARFIRAGSDARVAAEIQGLRLSLAGDHQRANAAVAWGLLQEVNALGVAVDDRSIRAGLMATRWPGRLEIFEYRGARVLVDAAHNPAGARALAAYLRETEREPVALVFGAMRDKAIDEMLTALAPAVGIVWCTTAPGPRARRADEVASAARSVGMTVRVMDDPVEALDRACAGASRVVVAGSIYLIGPLRARLAGRAILR